MPTEPVATSNRLGRAAPLCLAAAAVAYLLLTGLDAKATALLSGSLTLFGLKTVALDALLLAGLGYAALRLRTGTTAPRVLALIAAGAALWRGLDALASLAVAVSTDSAQYWRSGQLLTTTLLLAAAVAAALAIVPLARAPRADPSR